jgi:alpha-ribazole phosphatase
VYTSPLERSAAVGRWLRRFGFEHRVDADLAEMDFGDWEGRAWSAIGVEEVRAWERSFVHHAPGGGESLAEVFARVKRFTASHRGVCLVVGHAGWINAWQWVQQHPHTEPTAAAWPQPVAYGAAVFGSNEH